MDSTAGALNLPAESNKDAQQQNGNDNDGDDSTIKNVQQTSSITNLKGTQATSILLIS